MNLHYIDSKQRPPSPDACLLHPETCSLALSVVLCTPEGPSSVQRKLERLGYAEAGREGKLLVAGTTQDIRGSVGGRGGEGWRRSSSYRFPEPVHVVHGDGRTFQVTFL